MSLGYYPFDIQEVLKNNPPVPPADLLGLVEKLSGIKRFQDENYPDGIFDDNDYDHEVRLVSYSGLDIIKGVIRSKLVRMLWVHDIPEIVIGDTISPKKDEDEGLAKGLEISEEAAASQLLIPSDVKLLKIFNASQTFIKGRSEGKVNISEEGLVAAVLDKIDGNMFFHYSLAKWITEGGSKSQIPSRNALELTFKQRDQFAQYLGNVESRFPDTVETCLKLLSGQLNYIVGVWQSVPVAKQPTLISKQLKKL